MSLSLEQLRHLGKEILALAALELFPGTLLLDGGVDEISFFYDFRFPEKIVSLFGKQELERIEDQMHKLVFEKLPYKNLDMMRENAAVFLTHLGQPIRGESAALRSENIVSLVEFEEFRDLCPPLPSGTTEALKAFKLLKFQIISEREVRILGTAFEDKEELKEFLKKYRQASKNDPLILGKKLGYFAEYGKEWVWLPSGEALLWKLAGKWRELHLKNNYPLLTLPAGTSQKEMHKKTILETGLKKAASLRLDGGDLATLHVSQKELFEELISSLQFFQEAFKIFAFEIVVYCWAEKSSPLVQALERLGIDFKEETRFKEGKCVTFNSFDGYGRRVVLSSIEVEENGEWVHHSLFKSMKNWMVLQIEKI